MLPIVVSLVQRQSVTWARISPILYVVRIGSIKIITYLELIIIVDPIKGLVIFCCKLGNTGAPTRFPQLLWVCS